MKKILLIIFCILVLAPVANAEKLPIKITPAQVITTNADEIEVGDWIKFKTVNDVFYKNKLLIKKDTPIVGVVDHVHENGLVADNAEIIFQTFYVRNVEKNLIKFNYPLYIGRRNSVCKTFGDKIEKYFLVIFKGNEVDVQPESTVYNLFLYK